MKKDDETYDDPDDAAQESQQKEPKNMRWLILNGTTDVKKVNQPFPLVDLWRARHQLGESQKPKIDKQVELRNIAALIKHILEQPAEKTG